MDCYVIITSRTKQLDGGQILCRNCAIVSLHKLTPYTLDFRPQRQSGMFIVCAVM